MKAEINPYIVKCDNRKCDSIAVVGDRSEHLDIYQQRRIARSRGWTTRRRPDKTHIFCPDCTARRKYGK